MTVLPPDPSVLVTDESVTAGLAAWYDETVPVNAEPTVRAILEAAAPFIVAAWQRREEDADRAWGAVRGCGDDAG